MHGRDQIARKAGLTNAVIDITGVAHHLARDGKAQTARRAALQDREPRPERFARGRRDAVQLPLGLRGRASPEQRVHPRIVILPGEAGAIEIEQRRFRSVAHRSAAPRLDRRLARPFPAQRGQRQSLTRTRRIGQRRKFFEEGSDLVGISRFALQRLLGICPQLLFLREAGVGQQEAGVIVEREAAGGGKHVPALHRIAHRAALAVRQAGARLIPFAAILASHGGGNDGGGKQYNQGCSTQHAGHIGIRLLIRR